MIVIKKILVLISKNRNLGGKTSHLFQIFLAEVLLVNCLNSKGMVFCKMLNSHPKRPILSLHFHKPEDNLQIISKGYFILQLVLHKIMMIGNIVL